MITARNEIFEAGHGERRVEGVKKGIVKRYLRESKASGLIQIRQMKHVEALSVDWRSGDLLGTELAFGFTKQMRYDFTGIFERGLLIEHGFARGEEVVDRALPSVGSGHDIICDFNSLVPSSEQEHDS